MLFALTVNQYGVSPVRPPIVIEVPGPPVVHRLHRRRCVDAREHLDLVVEDALPPAIPGSEAAQFKVTSPRPTDAPLIAGGAATGSLVMVYSSVTMLETLFEGSKATNFSVVAAEIVIGAV